jgi:hypothetical protein
MYFVTDVETSGLTPWNGELLTIGIQPVTEQGDVLVGENLYIRLSHLARDPRLIPEVNQTDTNKFWLDQEAEIIEEAFGFRQERTAPLTACFIIKEWMEQIEPEWNQRFIVANPIAFDKMWMEYLYASREVPVPFHYRCLCLRSMRFGLEATQVFGSAHGNHESEKPHHGLYDAIGEAWDLADMINEKVKIYGVSV